MFSVSHHHLLDVQTVTATRRRLLLSLYTTWKYSLWAHQNHTELLSSLNPVEVIFLYLNLILEETRPWTQKYSDFIIQVQNLFIFLNMSEKHFDWSHSLLTSHPAAPRAPGWNDSLAVGRWIRLFPRWCSGFSGVPVTGSVPVQVRPDQCVSVCV